MPIGGENKRNAAALVHSRGTKVPTVTNIENSQQQQLENARWPAHIHDMTETNYI